MSLADYLAKNYLNADSGPKTKRTAGKKRKRKEASDGLIIADDDVLGWNNDKSAKEDDDGPLTGITPGMIVRLKLTKHC
jgi:pre-mRNA-splicing factor CWC26